MRGVGTCGDNLYQYNERTFVNGHVLKHILQPEKCREAECYNFEGVIEIYY